MNTIWPAMTCGAQPVIEIARAGSVKFTVGKEGREESEDNRHVHVL